jgi:hypothetical protein
MYEIKHLSPLSKKTIIIIHFIKNYFFPYIAWKM